MARRNETPAQAMTRIRARIATYYDRLHGQPERYYIRSPAQLARDIAMTPADHLAATYARHEADLNRRMARTDFCQRSADDQYARHCIAQGIVPSADSAGAELAARIAAGVSERARLKQRAA